MEASDHTVAVEENLQEVGGMDGIASPELAYHQKMHKAGLRLSRETQNVVERLRRAVFDL
jgi:hypothetical protein